MYQKFCNEKKDLEQCVNELLKWMAATCLQVCVQLNCQCLSSSKTETKHIWNNNLLRILAQRRIVFRTCNRTKLAGEINGCFAIMRRQFKIICARSGPAPTPSPFASVTDRNRPSTPLKSCIFLKHNCTKTLQCGLRGCDPTQKTQCSNWHLSWKSMNHNNYMKRLDHWLWLCRMARTTEIFLWIIFFFFHFSKNFAHFSNSLPRWGPVCPDSSSFCLLSSSEQEKGCFGVGLCAYISPAVWPLSKEQGLGWYSGQKETRSVHNETHLGNLYAKWAKVL